MKSKNLERKHPLCQPILALMKTNEVFNCARRLPFPPGTTCKTQLPSQHAAEQWVTFSVSCCCHSHWALSVRTTQTGPWPYKPNPNYCNPWYPAKRRNHSSSCSLWSFSKSGGKKTTPTNAAWGAIEHVKTLRLEFLGVWRSEIDWEQTGRDISLKIWSKAAMGASQPTRTRKKHFTRQTNSLSQQQKQKKLNDCLLEVSH